MTTKTIPEGAQGIRCTYWVRAERVGGHPCREQAVAAVMRRDDIEPRCSKHVGVERRSKYGNGPVFEPTTEQWAAVKAKQDELDARVKADKDAKAVEHAKRVAEATAQFRDAYDRPFRTIEGTTESSSWERHGYDVFPTVTVAPRNADESRWDNTTISVEQRYGLSYVRIPGGGLATPNEARAIASAMLRVAELIEGANSGEGWPFRSWDEKRADD